MAEGYVQLHRSLWESKHFRKEPFSEREAFIWLIASSAWKNHDVRYKDHALSLRRGQLSISIRDMAFKWGWHRARVERFLKRLKTESVIETDAETGVLVISICNYEKYQTETVSAETASKTPSETMPRHPRDTDIRRVKKGIKEKTEEEAYIYRSTNSPDGQSDVFEAWYATYPRRQGRGAAKAAFLKAISQAPPEQLLAAAQAFRDHCQRNGKPHQFIPLPATWLNQTRWLDELKDDEQQTNGQRYINPASQLLKEFLDEGMAHQTNVGNPDTARRNAGAPASKVIPLLRNPS